MNYKKKVLLLSFGLFSTISIFSQEVLNSKSSEVLFNAEKNIAAKNEKAQFTLRVLDNSIIGLIVIKDFIFSNSLMQEHFNENYMESDKYPKASFLGKLINFNLENVKERVKEYKAKGILKIHGVEQEVVLLIKMFKKKDIICLLIL